ncbi:MAG TPA: VWA domain-containing protein [Verrucomicrobiota bacterium]|nr:VWA domain-containing protein [Verrucomicrobiota bacterium]HRZ57666.1 VWA domain-containing protein [Candidatus Paceibacterota bacterium]
MSFLTPAAFAFAAAIPVVVLFYLLKRKRVVKLVSSTLLWQKYLAETQASAPFQKLRHNWLLVLQILLLLALIFALARPYRAGQISGGRLLVAIVDASASMQSTDETPSRFERARREALELVDSLHDTDQMVVLLAAGHTEVKQSPTGNKSALRRALQGCAVTDAPTRLAEALKLAQPLVKDRIDAEIHLFSDGAAADLTDFEHEGLNVVYHRLGARAMNVGIVGLDVRAHPEEPARRALFASVANASTNPVQTELQVLFDDQLIETRLLELRPRETVPQVFAATQAKDGIFTARLAAPDDLLADNQASLVSLLPAPVRVLLVTRGNRFLERALATAPGVQLSVADDLVEGSDDFDVTVLDDVLPAVWPAGNTLAIRSANTNWVEVTGRAETPAIVDWRTTHPLLRFVNFDNVQLAETLTVKPPTWAVSLVDSSASPLILAGEAGRQRLIWIGFDTLQTTWPLRISFPIFIANAVAWLDPSATKAGQFQVRAGDPIRLTLAESLTNATVRLPDGSERALAIDPGARELVFGQTALQGIYRLDAGTNRFVVSANLLDAAETDTTPKPELKFGKYARIEATSTKRASLEWWRWLAASALAVLGFEWWFYHRRTA